MPIISLFDKKKSTIEKSFIITIPYGFVPVSRTGNIKIYTSVDTSDLTVFNTIEREPGKKHPKPFPDLNQRFLLKGTLNYNVTLDGFKPFEAVDSGDSLEHTSFAVSGSMPVDAVLYKGKEIEEFTIDYSISLKAKEEFLINESGRVIYSGFLSREFNKYLKDPKSEKVICIPAVVEIKPDIHC